MQCADVLLSDCFLQLTGNRALLMELLQSGLKSVTLSYSYTNITPTDIANIIRCLRDNTTLKELTIRTIANQSEVYLTAYH